MKTKSMLLGAITFTCLIPITFAAKQGGFNPDISLVLDGRFGSYSNTSDYALPGFMLGGEASRGEKRFHLGHNLFDIRVFHACGSPWTVCNGHASMIVSARNRENLSKTVNGLDGLIVSFVWIVLIVRALGAGPRTMCHRCSHESKHL